MEGPMESMLTSINTVLEEREDKIFELDDKCYKLARLAKTLLSALEDSITHSKLDYETRKQQSKLTKSCTDTISTASNALKSVEEKIGLSE